THVSFSRFIRLAPNRRRDRPPLVTLQRLARRDHLDLAAEGESVFREQLAHALEIDVSDKVGPVLKPGRDRTSIVVGNSKAFHDPNSSGGALLYSATAR